MTATTWNPLDKSSAFTLSESDLRAACTTSGDNFGIRGTVGAVSGKFYFEWNSHSSYHSFYDGVGIAKTSALFGNFYAGTSGALVANGGAVVINGSNAVSSYEFGGSGTNYDIAVDIDAKLFWSRVNGGNWNNDPTANPATGTGGKDFSSTVGSGVEVRPSVSSSGGTIDGSAVFAAADWVRTAPSGFISWDAAGAIADLDLTADIADDAGLDAALTPPCTLNPDDMDAGLALSDGNLTVSATTTGSSKGVRGFTPHSTGFYYFEAHLNWTLNVDNFMGVTKGDASLGPYRHPFEGGPPPPAGIQLFGFIFGGGAPHDGGTYRFKVDLYRGIISVAHTLFPDDWHSSGGMDVGADYFPYGAVCVGPEGDFTPESITFNFGASSFISDVPDGHQSWDESQGTQGVAPPIPPLVIVGNVGGSSDDTLAAWSDDGGSTWTPEVLPNVGHGTGSSWVKACYSPALDMFVAIASQSGSARICARSVDDGHTWVDNTMPAGSRVLNDICWADALGLFVAVGSAGPSTTERIITSPDGEVWTPQDLPDASIGLRSVCWSPVLGMLLAVGNDNAVYSSTDGVTWVAEAAPATSKTWISVCWAGGTLQRFAMVANAGGGSNDYAYWDGSSAWTQTVVSGSAYSWLAIAYSELADMLMVVGGNTGVICTSRDGATFDQVDTGLGSVPFQSALFAELGGFWIVGGSNTLRKSFDAVSWFDLTSPFDANWGGLAASRNATSTTRLVADITDDDGLDATLHLDVQLVAHITDELGLSASLNFLLKAPPIQVVVICV